MTQYAMHTKKVSKTIKILDDGSRIISVIFVHFFFNQKLINVLLKNVGKFFFFIKLTSVF